MAFGLVLIVALLAAHTATAARTIDAGVQSDVTRTVPLSSDSGRRRFACCPADLSRQAAIPAALAAFDLLLYCKHIDLHFASWNCHLGQPESKPKCSRWHSRNLQRWEYVVWQEANCSAITCICC